MSAPVRPTTTASWGSTTSRRATELCLRLALSAAALLCAAAGAPPAAHAACPTLDRGACIEASFPAALDLGSPLAGTTATSAAQPISVSSNDTWGIKISSDRDDGRMAEFDGSAYVTPARALGDPLRWSLSSIGTTTYALNFAALSSTPASVVSGRAATACVALVGCGSDTVRLRFAQAFRFSDRRVAPMTYAIKVTYVAQHGF